MLVGGFASAANVVFLNPGKSNEAYWVSYTQFMQAAAADLGIHLQVLYAERVPEKMLEQARADGDNKQTEEEVKRAMEGIEFITYIDNNAYWIITVYGNNGRSDKQTVCIQVRVVTRLADAGLIGALFRGFQE